MADIARYPFVRHLRGSATTCTSEHIRNGGTVARRRRRRRSGSAR